MKSLPLYEEDLTGLTEDELRDQIEDLRALRSSHGFQIFQALLAARYADYQQALVDALPREDRADLALVQGKAQTLYALRRINRFDDDDESDLINTMIGTRQGLLKEDREGAGEGAAASGGDRELPFHEAMAVIYPDATSDTGQAIGNDSVPGSERGGRLEV